MKNSFTEPAERLAESSAQYIDLKVDEVKVRTAKGLSIALNRLLVAILLLTLCSIVLMSAAFGGVLLLGDLIGSYAAGAFIVAAIFLVLLIVLFLLRDKLFLNGLVRMFVRLFFEEEGGEDEVH